MPSRPPLRHCPLCGIAMQARKSHAEAKQFDRFECLNCHATIVEAPVPDSSAEPDDDA